MVTSNFRVERLNASRFRHYLSRKRRPCRYCYGTSTLIVNQLDATSKDFHKENGTESVLAKDPYRGHRIDIRV